MNQFVFSAFFVAAVLGGSLHNATGQMINPTVQTSSTRVAASRSAPATSAKPVVTTRVAPQAVVRPMGVPTQRFNSNLPRTVAPPASNPNAHIRRPSGLSNPGFRHVKRSAQRTSATTH